VIRGTGLYELWKKGLYKNYSPERLVDLIARVLALVPPWVRVYRIQRDIPMPLVTSGVEKGFLLACNACLLPLLQPGKPVLRLTAVPTGTRASAIKCVQATYESWR
jgi:hypothetical protein